MTRWHGVTVVAAALLALTVAFGQQPLNGAAFQRQLDKVEAQVVAAVEKAGGVHKPKVVPKDRQFEPIGKLTTEHAMTTSPVVGDPDPNRVYTVPAPVVKGVKLTPDGLYVQTFGDWPNTGFCHRNFPIGRHLMDPRCNDKMSGLRVPFGMSVRLCEHDGGGGAYGACQGFPPGEHYVGDDLNARGVTFVEVSDGMAVYMSTDEATVPGAVNFKVNVTVPDGEPKVSVSVSLDSDWYHKDYSIPLPKGCNVQVWESTKLNDATWNHSVTNDVLKIRLSVKPGAGHRNWVGVAFRCTSA